MLCYDAMMSSEDTLNASNISVIPDHTSPDSHKLPKLHQHIRTMIPDWKTSLNPPTGTAASVIAAARAKPKSKKGSKANKATTKEEKTDLDTKETTSTTTTSGKKGSPVVLVICPSATRAWDVAQYVNVDLLSVY
jgi:hypothetical protein